MPVITNIPSCLEMPAGTVEPVGAGAGYDTIAQAVEGILDDPHRHAQLRDGALRYARSWSVDDVTTRLVEIASEDLRAAAPRLEQATA
jgi:hypothetical protein